jgi:immunoglobulin-like protein involved in spore germination/sporulation and spore germination protein
MTNERDDEILGRALSRAIETLDAEETPYESSRVMAHSAKRGTSFWRVAALAASIVLAGALGSTLLERPVIDDEPVAASPTPPAGLSSAPTPSPAVASPNQDRTWVYFARDGLPPVGAYVVGASLLETSPESRIASRITALGIAAARKEAPAGATNQLPQDKSGGISVRVQGEVATVEFDPSNDWGVRGSAQTLALLQQLVYTITEEPGIRRALIIERGKPNAVIDQLVIDKPLAREDVLGYSAAASPESIEDAGDGTVADIVDWRASVDDVAAGLGRFVVELKPTNTTEPRPYPKFSATLERPIQEKRTDDGKWVIRVELPDATWQQPQGEAFHCCPFKPIATTPIRQISAYPLGANPAPLPGSGTQGGGAYRGVGFAITLDDARPWRVTVLHNPLRLVVDVGGTPEAVSDSVAVYSPRAGVISRTFAISGLARAFEATVSWRIKDPAGREVAKGFTTASIGTSPVWGSFQTTATIPSSVSGNLTLEVFWASPRDGADVGLVQVPLTVR